MTVQQYEFQSPSSNQVQVGRPVPGAAQESTQKDLDLGKSANQTLSNAQVFQANQTKEVTPKVDSSHLLDLYA